MTSLADLHALMSRLGHPVVQSAPGSGARFPDGAPYRFEIPSVEGPEVLEAVVAEADRLGVPVARTSQGSGVMMLTDEEITRMARIGAERGIEVNLFLGPRAAWDTGGQAKLTQAVGAAARGNAMVAACLADALRACSLGIRSLLVGDLGTLDVLRELKADGTLPANLVLKTSVLMRSRTARPRPCTSGSARPPSTWAPTSPCRTWPRSGPPPGCRSTSTWRCRTTRAGSCASTRPWRSSGPPLPST